MTIFGLAQVKLDPPEIIHLRCMGVVSQARLTDKIRTLMNILGEKIKKYI